MRFQIYPWLIRPTAALPSSFGLLLRPVTPFDDTDLPPIGSHLSSSRNHRVSPNTNEKRQPSVRRKEERESGWRREERSSLRYDNGDYNERSQSLSHSPVLTPPINASGFQGPDRHYKGSRKEQNEGGEEQNSWRIAARMTARDQPRWHYDGVLVDIFWGTKLVRAEGTRPPGQWPFHR